MSLGCIRILFQFMGNGESEDQLRTTFGLAFVLWAVWTAATYLLEGRILTLLRPEAVGARILYVVIANLTIGTLGAGLLLRHLVRADIVSPGQVGFAAPRRSLVAVLVGGGLGFGVYFAQGAPTLDPVVLLNGFAQVLAVSIAEVLVCWAVVGGLVAAGLARGLGSWRQLPAAMIAAVLFGVYHYAHSPPFNTHAMVVLLTIVGLVTGTFFFISRDIYGTVVFHNFLGVFGVLGALERSGRLETNTVPQLGLLGTAAAAVAVLAGVHLLCVRTRSRPAPSRASA